MKPTGFFAALIFLLYAVGSCQTSSWQAFPASPSESTTIHVSSNLILLDVSALNAKTGALDQSLSKADFEVFEDDQPVPIRTFDSGPATRPLAVWFIVQCGEGSEKIPGPKISAIDIPQFKPALDMLGKEDLVGVAHWCDDGNSQIDILPTSKVDDAIEALKQALAHTSETRPSLHGDGFWATLHSVIDNTLTLTRERFPLVILLDDNSTMSSREANYILERLLKTSTTIYGIRSDQSSRQQIRWHNNKEISTTDYLATETGGRVIFVTPATYAARLKSILDYAHSRYELGFAPAALDDQRHSLYVRLTPAAKSKHRGVTLQYRSQYVATRNKAP